MQSWSTPCKWRAILYAQFPDDFSYYIRLSLVGDVGGTEQPRGLDLLARLAESASGGEADEEVKRLHSHIKLNEALSGIKFESVDWEIKHTGVCVCIRWSGEDEIKVLASWQFGCNAKWTLY